MLVMRGTFARAAFFTLLLASLASLAHGFLVPSRHLPNSAALRRVGLCTMTSDTKSTTPPIASRRTMLAAWAAAGAAAAVSPAPVAASDSATEESKDTTFLRARLDDKALKQLGNAAPFTPNQLYYPVYTQFVG